MEQQKENHIAMSGQFHTHDLKKIITSPCFSAANAASHSVNTSRGRSPKFKYMLIQINHNFLRNIKYLQCKPRRRQHQFEPTQRELKFAFMRTEN